jgi:condensin-2 complex subunit D3
VVDLPATTSKSEQEVAAAKGRLLSKISRKHLVETILPILCNLKAILQASCSPLLKDLMQYLAEMCPAYKHTIHNCNKL